MKLDVIPVAGKIHVARLMDTTAIVVDVLRATTCMVVGIQNGIVKIIPTSDAAEAASFVTRLGSRDSLLAGETGGVKTQGFDIGNSPFEFSVEAVKGRTVIMSTTNGTTAVCASASADNVLIGAMVNATAVAKRAVELGKDVVIICAGTDGAISADDLIAAGAIAEEIIKGVGKAVCTDTVSVSRWLYKGYMEKRVDIHEINHCKKLIELGFEDDVKFCFRRDMTDVVPVYSYGIIQ
ncbi:MAG: 2-phosphosulfolactate phosphatase [Eubacteriales bacterium]|nr:2-phosphosulfolactate phosphatase [Eubacteriales bacterium]